MGVEVVDERPYEIEPRATSRAVDLRLRAAPADAATSTRARRSPSASRTRSPRPGRGEAESDGFNALVAAGRADLAAGRWCCARTRKYLRQTGLDVQPGVHRGSACRPTSAIAAAAGRAVRGPVRPGRPPADRERELAAGAASRRSSAALDDVASLDQDRILRSFLALDPGDAAHQLLPARRRRRGRSRTSSFKLDPQRDPRPARAAAEVRDLRLLAAGRGRAPALRRGRPRRPALVATGARTSAPRSSAWSRRRWSRTR